MHKESVTAHHEHHHVHGDISGGFGANFANGQSLDDFCTSHIPEYNRDRFEAFALRILAGKETVITIYALDKTRQEGSSSDPDKIPVKKFKIDTLPVNELFSYFESFNCTLTTGNYELDDMEVINK